MTDAERKELTDRIALELRIRQELETQLKKPKSTLKSWLESSFVLLVLGSIVTGFLVPYFQQRQETIRWQRQNQHDNFSYRLGQMRLCLQQFLDLTAYPSDVNEISKTVLANARAEPKQVDDFTTQFRGLQQKRFHDTTKVLSLFIHFPRAQPLDALYTRYLEAVNGFMSPIESIAQDTREALGSRDPDRWKALEQRSNHLAESFASINTAFDAVLAEMRTQIKEIERESEQLE